MSFMIITGFAHDPNESEAHPSKAFELQFKLINFQRFHKLIKNWNLIRIS